jgi:hypothetical protein
MVCIAESPYLGNRARAKGTQKAPKANALKQIQKRKKQMFSNIVRKAFTPAALLVAAGSLYAAPAATNSQPNGPVAVVTIVTVTPEYPAADEASDLLKQLRTEASSLSRDGATLASFNRSGVSATTHQTYLNYVKERVNQTGADLARLEQIRDDAAPWQQKAIDQIVPIARDIASNTQSAILQLNENSNPLMSPGYAETLQAIAESTSDLNKSVSGFLTAEAINQKADKLHEKAYQLQIKADQLQMKLAGANS